MAKLSKKKATVSCCGIMGGAVSLGRLRCIAAPSTSRLVTQPAPPKLKAVQQAYVDVRFPVLSRFSARNVKWVHAVGRKARCNSTATSAMAGPEAGVPAVEAPRGGVATLDNDSGDAAGLEACT